jgi:indolepyruvate ferredoxin oxidoreductase
VQIATAPEAIRTTKVGVAEADLVLACDPIVAAHANTLSVMHAGRSHVVLNVHQTPTAALVKDRDWSFPGGQCDQVLLEQVGSERLRRLDAARLAEQCLGDALYANPVMLGYAWQMGWLPLQWSSLRKAIELNGVQVERNLQALTCGRWAAHDPTHVATILMPAQPIQWLGRPPAAPDRAAESLEALVSRRANYLADYQNQAYAQRYRDWIERIRAAEQGVGGDRLAREVAIQLFRLMAVKDEYEVARLLTAPGFCKDVAAQFEGPWCMAYHLAPPRWWGGAPTTERPNKHRFGPWMGWVMRGMAMVKAVRNTWLDPFKHSADRKEDRAILAEFETRLAAALPGLNASTVDQLVAMVRLADGIRGYGAVRLAAIRAVRVRWQQEFSAGA